MSHFGWTYLSKAALRKAQAQLSGQSDGVRDEIGFLQIHQGYSDRFFPGTSVLHTRLRYVLFVPWMYETLRERRLAGPVDKAVAREEVRLVGRLINAGKGVIGGKKAPESSHQPPSVVYWAALAKWGILRKHDNDTCYSRQELHALLKNSGSRTDDDGLSLHFNESPFVALPSPPKEWFGDSELSFALQPREAKFIWNQWQAAPSPVDLSRESLLSLLARSDVAHINNCWDNEILKLAGPDRIALMRAERSASLCAIGRAVYASLVEILSAELDKRTTNTLHQQRLKVVIHQHRAAAGSFDLDDLTDDIGSVRESLRLVLHDTHRWVLRRREDPRELLEVYTSAEVDRKKERRARLARTVGSRDKRAEWIKEDHPESAALHYRWANVRTLITDLRAAR